MVREEMVGTILKAILLLALPIAVFTIGAWTMERLAGRQQVKEQFDQAAAEDRSPLSMRVAGYNVAEVERHWGALDAAALGVERRFLEFDLVFPVLYGAALAAALLLAWVALGRPFHPLWLISPVVITVVADWTENLVQLDQLELYLEQNRSGLQDAWIQIASIATILKLVFFVAASLLLVLLAVWMIVRAVHSPS